MSYLVIFLLFLLQFIYFPLGLSYFEVPKVYTAEICIAVLTICIILSKHKFSLRNSTPIAITVPSILVAVSLLDIVFHFNPRIVWGNQFRLQGTFLVWLLLLFAYITNTISIEKKVKPWFIFLILCLQLLCSLLLVPIGESRGVGTIGEPNSLAGITIFLWPFLFFMRKDKSEIKRKSKQNSMARSTRQDKITLVNVILTKLHPNILFRLFGFLCTILIILISSSRSGIIALLVQISFLLCCKVFRFNLKRSLIFALAVLLASYALPLLDKSIYENRGEIWLSGLVAGMQYPITGIGFGNAEYALHQANLRLHNHLPGYYVDSAHNLFLDWFIQSGIIGLLVLIFHISKAFSSFLKQEKIRNILVFLGVLSVMSFNPVSIVILIPFWWLIGQGLNAK